MNILFVSSEAYPLIKTGGLADVAGSLPRALMQMKQDVCLLLPAYQSVLDKVNGARVIAATRHYGQDIRILQTQLPGTRVKTWLVDCPAAFGRAGNPYVDADGLAWVDNAFRFALFCQVAVDIALNRLTFDWPVDIVHCNDWQTGLVPALLSRLYQHPATLFTIHNLAYQGVFEKQVFTELALQQALWSMHGVEFHDLFSFIKGGLSFADCINTVSPQYAREIQTEAFGYGLQHLLKHRSDRLSGILNGIDTDIWNPGTDDNLYQKYNSRSLHKKADNKLALQQQFALKGDKNIPLIGFIGRLVEQKGLDLILTSLPELIKMPLQLVFLGSGQASFENELVKWAKNNPQTIAVEIGYDEQLSHRIEAASDMFLMPSLFEPCGLNQLYSLRYGTIPVVTPVGGLKDSVTDCTEQHLSDRSATGFVLKKQSPADLTSTITRAVKLYTQPEMWKQLQLNGMRQDFSWKASAVGYLDLYNRAIEFNKQLPESTASG